MSPLSGLFKGHGLLDFFRAIALCRYLLGRFRLGFGGICEGDPFGVGCCRGIDFFCHLTYLPEIL